MTSKIHPFDEAMLLEPIGADVMRGRTTPPWANMVGPFGGITAAVLLHAIEIHPDRLGDPLALTVNFAAAIEDGEFDIRLRAARTNRTNQHWTLELVQGGDIKTTATAIFGIRRESWSGAECPPPPVPAPEDIERGALIDAVIWSHRYDLRIAEGPIPRDEPASPSSTTTLWMRDVLARRIDYPALAAYCDVFFPRAFLRLGKVVPAGTISLTTYFHADRNELAEVDRDYVLGRASANRFAAGHFDQTAQVWSRQGGLLASTHQLVYFKG